MESLSTPRNQESCLTISILWFVLNVCKSASVKTATSLSGKKLSKLIRNLDTCSMRTFRMVSQAHSSSKSLCNRHFLSLKLPFNWAIIVCQHIDQHKCKNICSFQLNQWHYQQFHQLDSQQHISFLWNAFLQSLSWLWGHHHTLPVFPQIMSDFNQSSWQSASSLLLIPEKRIRPVWIEQAIWSDSMS